MDTIQAAQHIYANVEADQSPHNRGGWHTLFYTHNSLSEEEVEEIESRLYYKQMETNPFKRLFFTTTTGQVVVSQAVSVAGGDCANRQGRYMAHSLVFTRETFAALSSSPLCLFRQFPFITTVEQALAQGNRQTGDIRAATVEIDITETRTPPAESWHLEDLKQLALLALRAKELAADRTMLALTGTPQAIEATLDAAFVAVPAALRTACSFDTHFVECNPAHMYYWAVGLPERCERPQYIRIDVQTKHVFSPQPISPTRAYERWVWATIHHHGAERLSAQRDQAFALCEWLEGHQVADVHLPSIDGAVLNAVFQTNEELVRDRVRKRLGEHLPPPLMERAFRRVYPGAKSEVLFDALRNGFTAQPLLHTLYQSYEAEHFVRPDRKERGSLASLLTEVDHPRLRLILACWEGDIDYLRIALGTMGEDEYLDFARIALDHLDVRPFTLLVPGKGDMFVRLLLPHTCSEDMGIERLVKQLLSTNELAPLVRLVPLLRQCTTKEIAKLDKLISAEPDVPKAFCEAITARLARDRSEHPPGVLGRLRARLSRWGNRNQDDGSNNDQASGSHRNNGR